MYTDAADGPDRQIVFSEQPLQQNECAFFADASAGFMAFRNQSRETGFASARRLSAGCDLEYATARFRSRGELGILHRLISG